MTRNRLALEQLPPRVFAASVTWVSVEGYTCPRASSMRSHTEIASGNDPHASSSATSIKFPSEWLFAMGKRYLNARVSGSFGSAAIARIHLRTSPGGVTSASSRKKTSRAAVVGHGHHSTRLDVEGEKSSDGNRRARAAADDDSVELVAARGMHRSRQGQNRAAPRRLQSPRDPG